MSLPRLKAEMGLLELSAFARLRGALFGDVLERLPAAMKSRTAARGSSGDLREKWRAALEKATQEGFEGEDAQVIALASMLDAEADEVHVTLQGEVKREFETAAKVEAVIVAHGESQERSG